MMSGDFSTGPVRSQAGFTLIELLVALVVTGIIVAAAYSIQIQASQSFSVQDRVAEMQQELRIASNSIVKDLQMTGYKVPGRQGLGFMSGAPGSIGIDQDGDGTADLVMVMDGNGTSKTDAVEIWKGGALPIDIVSYNAPAATAFVNAGCGLTAGQVVMALSAAGTDYSVFQVSSVTTGIAGGTLDRIGFAPGQSPLNTSQGLSADYTGGQIVSFTSLVYYIDWVDTDGDGVLDTPELIRNVNGAANVVARNIEDLQLQYGIDTNNDNVVDSWVDDPSANLTQVRSVQVALLARTSRPDRFFNGGAFAALYNGNAHAADGRRRRVLTTRVFMPNMQFVN